MKVVGVGLNKTGTKTLGACLRHLGLKHVTYNYEAFQLWRKGDYGALLQRVKDYESFEDWPWPLIYKEIDEAFSGTKFILTRRQDAETWFKSLCKHAKRVGPLSDYEKYIYGYEMPHRYKQEHINFYENHNKLVRDHFKNRPDDLLEVCWEEGDGWDALSAFLGVEKPEIPFPHEHASPTLSRKVRSLMRCCKERLSSALHSHR